MSCLTFGAWQLGGTWGTVNDEEALAALRRAFELGIDLVDTAPLYGAGRSEELVGQAVRTWRGARTVRVATKVPPARPTDPDHPACTIDVVYPRHHIRRSVEDSLRRLGTERVDLIQLHQWVPGGECADEWRDELGRLRSEGKVDAIGVSLRDIRPAPGVALARSRGVDALQVMFNLFEQEPLGELFPVAAGTGTGILARVPFDSGALTGSWTEETYAGWSGDDKRRAMYREGRFAETLRRVWSLRETTGRWFPDLAEAAMRFALHPTAVSTVVVGMRSVAEVERNVALIDGTPWPEELTALIAPHRWKHAFYD